jgi:hypothetical protein
MTIVTNIAIPGLYEGIYRAKASAILEDFELIRDTARQHYTEHHFYPQEVGAGKEPPELRPYLRNQLRWTHQDYQYDWEVWVDGAGDPTAPATGALVGFSVVTTDPKLIEALRKLYKGTILNTLPNRTTFIIEPYAG